MGSSSTGGPPARASVVAAMDAGASASASVITTSGRRVRSICARSVVASASSRETRTAPVSSPRALRVRVSSRPRLDLRVSSRPSFMSSTRSRRSVHASARNPRSGTISEHSPRTPPLSASATVARARDCISMSNGRSTRACSRPSTTISVLARPRGEGVNGSSAQRSVPPPCTPAHQTASRSSIVARPPVE